MLQLKDFSLCHLQERWFKAPLPHPLLNNINLDLHRGELVALVGNSGAGKSLLLQSMLGLLPAAMKASGLMAIDGQKIEHQQFNRLRGKIFSYIPQSISALNPLRQVGCQLSRAAKLGGNPATRQRLVAQLARYHLPETLLNQYPLSLSGGMAKRILVSGATLSQAPFILADEVTAWLDNNHAERLLQHLKTLCQQGQGVLWVTHDLHLAAQFADRIAVLHQGTIQEVISADQLRAGQGSGWLQSLWHSLPEQQFISTVYNNTKD